MTSTKSIREFGGKNNPVQDIIGILHHVFGIYYPDCLLHSNMTDKLSGSHYGSSASFAHLFEQVIHVLSLLIVDTSRAGEKSHESFEARQRLLTWLCAQVGLDIVKREIEYSTLGIRVQKSSMREVLYRCGMYFDHVRAQTPFA